MHIPHAGSSLQQAAGDSHAGFILYRKILSPLVTGRQPSLETRIEQGYWEVKGQEKIL
jgi:hypothetical protein